jgi:hypothetical protein
MELAKKRAAAGEVHYYNYDEGHEDPYNVPVEAQDANGGWLAAPSHFVDFALGVFSAEVNAGAPALLKLETQCQMPRASAAKPEYACGWSDSPDGNRYHSGGLDGTTNCLTHRRDGLAQAAVVNTRRQTFRHGESSA